MKIEIIQGTMKDAGGYSIDGKQFVGEEYEAVVDEAKAYAYDSGRSVIECLTRLVAA